MFNTKNKIVLILSAIIIIFIGFYWFFKNKYVKPTQLFKTEKPIKKDLIQYVKASGTLKAKDQISVGSLVDGKVEKIFVDNNDFVKKEQILAILDNGIGDSSVKKLTAELKQSKENANYYEKFYKRQTALYKSKQISKDLYEQYTKELEILRAQVLQKEAELEIKIKEYENTFIKSPVDGIIIAKEIDLGQMITSRLDAKVLFVIAKDLKCMEADVNVDEADIGMVKEGQDVIFTVDAFPKLEFKAKVRKIRYLSKFTDEIVTYGTILNVSNPNLKLRPGMTTNVQINVAQTKNSLVVKNKALRIDSNILKKIAVKLNFKFKKMINDNQITQMDHVWILKNKKFKQIKVKLGARQGMFTQIISKEINNNIDIVNEVTQVERENILLKQVFARPGSIGKQRKK
ncbi:efflux RND transporter periplasmic adaptor subunit [Candidatus Babeliales bacterium]|nr:efflux RND transporter periplasmic adaptor subunit [Candidatus Babeliales bacterium]